MGSLKQSLNRARTALRRYVPVMFHISISSLKNESAGTFGGFLWWIGEPMLYAVIYYFVFAIIFQTKTENFIAFLLIGLTVWRWLSLTVITASNSVAANATFMRQLHIPKIIFPVQTVVMQIYKFIIALIVIWVLLKLFNLSSDTQLLHFPFVFLTSVTFITGLGLILSVIMPFFPDLKNVNALAFRALLFMSGVFFESHRVPEEMRFYYYLNPFVTLIEGFRDVLIHGRVPDYFRTSIILLVGVCLVLAGLYLHQRLNRVFPRYLI